jgi:hypothetical protein
MRRILRAAGKALAVLLWVARGLLLLLAVGAMVLWPVSCGRPVVVHAERFTAGPASGEYRGYFAGCWDGRAVLSRGWLDAGGGPRLALIREQVASGGEGWRWQRWSDSSPWADLPRPSRWGPLRWKFTDLNDPDWTYRYRYVAAPPWGVSLAAGAWPLASLTLLIRRRRKRRPLARVGCCKKCGYDLRATAVKGGPLLARCPECGAAAPARKGKGETEGV